MIPYLGDFAEDETLYIAFNTFDSNDPAASVTITNLADADIKVHKDGSATQIVTDGATVAIDFDSITGNHLVTIDTSAHADYSVGSDYHVRIEGTTVDGATINAWIGHFSIENRFKEVDITHVMGTILTEGGAGRLAAAFIKLFDVATPTLVASSVMRGTDGANTTVPDEAGTAPTAAEVVNEWETQSQADPTGFHVNLKEADSQTVTAAAGVTINPEVGASATAMDAFEDQYDGTGLTGDTFPAPQSQVGNLTSGTAAINTVAASVDVTTGVEVNAYTDTAQLDGTVHEVNPSGGNTEFYYQFSVGGNGVPVSVTWQGYANSNGDSYTVKAYNWGGTAFETIGTISAVNGSTVITESFDLTNAHVGTGANIGLVRWEITSADGTGFNTDRILCSYAVVAQSVGYALGAIWYDDSASNTNTTAFVDGVADNPVSTWAAVLTLIGSVGVKRVQMANGSSVTLTGSSDNYTLSGNGWTLALGGQSIVGIHVSGASVSGVSSGTGTTQIFEHCIMGAVSLIKGTHILTSSITGTQTVVEAGDFFYDRCHSGVAGTGTWSFDFGAAIGNANLNVRNYSGGIQLEAMGDTGTDTASIEGRGQIIEGTCTGGTVAVRGLFTISGITNLNLSDDARFDSVQLVDDIWDEVLSMAAHNVGQSGAKMLRQGSDIVQIDGAVSDGSPSTSDFDTNLTQIDGYFDDAILVFSNGAANAGIGMPVSAYLNANGNMAFLSPDIWPVTPVNGDDFVIYAIHVHTIGQIANGVWDEAVSGHVSAGTFGKILERQEETIVNGTAATGTLSTTEMTTDLTITVNDQMNGRILTFRKDTATAALQGQQTDITDTVTTNGKLTFTALTTAPANGDKFEIN